jgi:hypothetical protein
MLVALSIVCGCSAEPVDQTDQTWDSAGGNPTHATHSYLTEHALDALQDAHPALATYRADVLDGANEELHELPVADPELESLRLEAGGTNSGCEHPEVYFAHAEERWLAGDPAKALWFVGILLHFVEDLGVPAHALQVWHESSPTTWDHFELLAFQRWAPRFDDVNREDPAFASPSDYVAFSGDWAASDFGESFPGVTYERTLFAMTWLFAPDSQKAFVEQREGRTATAATWALAAAIQSLEALNPSP